MTAMGKYNSNHIRNTTHANALDLIILMVMVVVVVILIMMMVLMKVVIMLMILIMTMKVSCVTRHFFPRFVPRLYLLQGPPERKKKEKCLFTIM